VNVNKSVNIRPIAASDLAGFRELRLKALQEHPAAFSSDYAVNLAQPQEYWQNRLNSAINSSQQIIFVAEDAGALVGMTGIFRGDSPKTEHSAMIFGVYVRPSHWGLRLGENLLQACHDWARNQGVRIVKLGVAVDNAPAIRCYQRAGYLNYGTEPKAICVNGLDYDEYLMALEI
jgi:RimJ/RimL family protein N-acetyltransferase